MFKKKKQGKNKKDRDQQYRDEVNAVSSVVSSYAVNDGKSRRDSWQSEWVAPPYHTACQYGDFSASNGMKGADSDVSAEMQFEKLRLQASSNGKSEAWKADLVDCSDWYSRSNERCKETRCNDPFNSQMRKSTLRRNKSAKEPLWPPLRDVPFAIRKESKALQEEVFATLNDAYVKELDGRLRASCPQEQQTYNFHFERAFLDGTT